jgi:hypothetical protein
MAIAAGVIGSFAPYTLAPNRTTIFNDRLILRPEVTYSPQAFRKNPIPLRGRWA